MSISNLKIFNKPRAKTRLYALALAGVISITSTFNLTGCNSTEIYNPENNSKISDDLNNCSMLSLSELYLFTVHNTETDETEYVIGDIKKRNSNNPLLNAYTRLVGIVNLAPNLYEDEYVNPYDYISYETYDGKILCQVKVGEESKISDTNYEVSGLVALSDFLAENGFDKTNTPHDRTFSDGRIMSFKPNDLYDLTSIINDNYKDNIKIKTMQP